MGSTENLPPNFGFPFAKSFWGSNPEFLVQESLGQHKCLL